MLTITPANIKAICISVSLLVSMSIIFLFFTKLLGRKTGYFAGFWVYWLVWCLYIPSQLISPHSVLSLFQFDGQTFKKDWMVNVLCLAVPLVFAYTYAFPKALKKASRSIIFLSLPLAVVNASCEEVLWRGAFLSLVTAGKWEYVLLSASGFAIWHFAPQLIFKNKAPGGQWSFVAFSFFLGILYALVVYNTGSVLLATLSHILFDFSGLGARIYLAGEDTVK